MKIVRYIFLCGISQLILMFVVAGIVAIFPFNCGIAIKFGELFTVGLNTEDIITICRFLCKLSGIQIFLCIAIAFASSIRRELWEIK